MDGCLAPDRPLFRRRLHGIRRAIDAGRPVDAALAALEAELGRSAGRRASRAQAVPAVSYPEDLPVAQARAEVAAALARSQVVIVSGDTGSGKTTQLPKICLEAGRGVDGAITLTQPRRIAARSVAARIASELGTTLGDVVGFKVRFDDRTGARSLVRVVTDGVLLAEIERDPLLLRSDTIIVDEAHERSLNVDFLLGYLKRLLPRRPDLKVIVASATIDVERFAAHFGGAPIVAVGGRLHPIETRWRPEPVDAPEQGIVDAALRGIAECLESGPGDILAFLGGERDILDTADALARTPAARGCEVLPLFARLPAGEQDRVFQPSKARRIVLATNVAETSVTVPGVRYVVDTGVARIARWSGRTRVLRLPVEQVSRASADQRRGRCGRIGPGICVRMYAESDYQAREAFTPAELLRTNLASVILQMKALGLGEVADFPFLDAPSPRLVAEGTETLVELGALDRRHALTPLGMRMAALPVDPRLARMLMAASDEHVLAEGLVLAAALSIQDPRERPPMKQGEADFAHAAFRDPESDFGTLLRLWRRWRAESAALGSSALRRWCRTSFLSHQRMREWTDLVDQLRGVLADRLRLSVPPLGEESDLVRVHRAVLAGFVSQLGMRTEDGDYRTASGARFAIFPGSTLARRTPTWVVAAEIVETTRRWGRMLARVQGDWVERIAPHLVQRVRSEPHWVRATGQVAAWERVSFGELPIVARRRVPYGPDAPTEARTIFIQAALVEGDCDLDVPFVRHNRQLLARVEAMEAKRRERGLLAGGPAIHAFFDARVPADVHSLPSFERWRRRAESQDPRALFMRDSDVLQAAPDPDLAARFPDELPLGSAATARLAYVHEPGSGGDGVRLEVHVDDLPLVDAGRLEWLVPGRLAEKVEGLVRALPKRLRTRLFPVKEVAQGAAEALAFGEGPLLPQLARHLSRVAGTEIVPGDFELAALPPHLSMHVEVVDDAGRVVARGNDVDALRRQLQGLLAERRQASLGDAFGDAWRRTGLHSFDLPELPERVAASVGGRRIVAFPALVDAGDSVSVALCDSADEAERLTRGGLRRLFAMACQDAIAHHLEYMPELDPLVLTWLGVTGAGRAALVAALELAAAAHAFVDGQPIVRTPAEFEARLDAGSRTLRDSVVQAVRAAALLYGHAADVLRALDAPAPAAWAPALADVRVRLARLASPAALMRVPLADVPVVVRYVDALGVRLRRLAGPGLDRDRTNQALVAHWEDELARAEAQLASEGRDAGILEPFRRLVEEYHVSLFAQELRTAVPVSAERLARAWSVRTSRPSSGGQ